MKADDETFSCNPATLIPETLIPALPMFRCNGLEEVRKIPRSKRNHSKLAMWRMEVKDRIKSAAEKLNEMQKEKLALFELEFQNSLMAISKNVLNTVINMKDVRFRAFILGIEEDISDETGHQSPVVVGKISMSSRKRSRSASRSRASQRVPNKIRSTSVDILKTPRGRMRLSTIMSHKKYTVSKSKRMQNSGLQVKRIMKPDEEAISTCGSPLYVASGYFHAPHVNIPLPGGVVLNIEPKSPKGSLEIPGLDEKTKSQIKLLCEQLKKLC